jgi:hypothetical protein
MNLSDRQLFLAVFFNEPEKIKAIMKARNGNARLLIPISNNYCELWLRFHGKLAISAIEPAVMLADSLFDIKEKTRLNTDIPFNPSEEYRKAEASIAFLKDYTTLTDIDYNKYYNLNNTIGDDEDYLSDDEIAQYLTEGYRLIDLQLVNYAHKRNEAEVRKLIAQGANPNIDPLDRSSQSIALDSLGADESLAFMQYIAYRKDGYNENYPNKEIMDMLAILYDMGSSGRLTRIIVEGINQKQIDSRLV